MNPFQIHRNQKRHYKLKKIKKGIYVNLLSEWTVRTPVDLYPLLKRSHAVFVIIEQMTIENIKGQTHIQIKVGKFNIVDLADSERIRITGVTGQQLEESKKIKNSF